MYKVVSAESRQTIGHAFHVSAKQCKRNVIELRHTKTCWGTKLAMFTDNLVGLEDFYSPSKLQSMTL